MKHKLIAMLQFITRPTLTGKHEGKTIVLDYMKIEDANIKNCKYVYFGCGDLTMNSVNSDNCDFTFSGKAANTLAFMKAMDGGDIIKFTFPKTIAKAICEDRKNTIYPNDMPC